VGVERTGANGDVRPRVVIAGGGTGGHFYPGLAVAHELRRLVPESVVTFAGTARGIESRIAPVEGFELDVIRSAGLKGKSPLALLRGLALLPAGVWDAWRIVRRRRPGVVVGVGGYSSAPVVLVAALRGVPTLVLEQNAVPGLANRRLARFVTAAAVTYEEALAWFGGRGFVSGNPVRAGFLAAAEPGAASPGTGRRLLVFGGSQGAHAINRAMIDAAPALARAGVDVVHQTGARDLEAVRQAYGEAGLTARVEAFLDHMDHEMAHAAVIVCRAGATTLAEVTAAGRAAVLVPLPTATDDHQRRNAEAMARAGAAEVVEQRDLTGEVLARQVLGLLEDAPRRTRLAAAARRLARPEAAQVIAGRVIAMSRESRR
jgi:UDP-N-acetylglucosamine--N-acetylmuramyl-(pentapeptide) pyrophosphoryl-undecaprenol N-acetylglucosamine transferase